MADCCLATVLNRKVKEMVRFVYQAPFVKIEFAKTTLLREPFKVSIISEVNLFMPIYLFTHLTAVQPYSHLARVCTE